MTVEQFFKYTVGMMGMTPANSITYRDTFLDQVNSVLARLFELQNNNRVYRGESKLPQIPFVGGFEEEIPYDDTLVKNILVWGVAQSLALTDDDTVKATYYGAVFADTYKEYSKNIITEVHDYFGGDSEW